MKKRIPAKCRIFLVVCFLLFASQLVAHPHVFIKTASKFSFANGRLSGVEVEWEFDEFFSNQVVSACDLNKDKRFSSYENNMVKNKFFKNLRHFNYFVYIWVNNVSLKVNRVSRFKAFVRGRGKVVYRFYVPIRAKVEPSKKVVKLMYLDESNFVAFFAPQKSIRVVGTKPVVIQALNNKRAQYQLAFKR